MKLRDLQRLSPRELHALRQSEQVRRRECQRLQILEQARTVIPQVATRHPQVRRVFLFGSILHPSRFDSLSDIDLAVECDLEAETPFARTLEQALGRAVDLRPLRGPVAEAVHEEGEQVYG